MSEQRILGADGLTARDSGVWAKDKLYYLERYLYIFSGGMNKKWQGKLHYVDLFAGPGRCLMRETEEEIDGSPLIALKFNFAKYFFFEADAKCYKALSQRVEVRAPEKDVVLIDGDCNRKIDEVEPPTGSLGIAFIDPTGISQLSFDTVRKLTNDRQIDLIINFSRRHGDSDEPPSIPSKGKNCTQSLHGKCKVAAAISKISDHLRPSMSRDSPGIFGEPPVTEVSSHR